jgi:hypothetical protein
MVLGKIFLKNFDHSFSKAKLCLNKYKLVLKLMSKCDLKDAFKNIPAKEED